MRIKGLAIITCITIALLAGCGKIYDIKDFTKLSVGNKAVAIDPANLSPGTIEDVGWRYFKALIENDRKTALSLCSSKVKEKISTDNGWESTRKWSVLPQIDMDGKFTMAITAYKGRWVCALIGYSKKSNSKVRARNMFIVLRNGKVKVGIKKEPTFE